MVQIMMMPQCLYTLPKDDVMVEPSSLQKIPVLATPQRQIFENNDSCYQCYCSTAPLADMIVEEDDDNDAKQQDTQQENPQFDDSSWATRRSIANSTATSLTPIPELEYENEDGSIPELKATSSNESDATTVVTNLTSTTKEIKDTRRQEEEKEESKVEEELLQEEDSNAGVFSDIANQKCQIILPAWLITGDDIAQIAPEACQPPIRYMEHHCICQHVDNEDDQPLLDDDHYSYGSSSKGGVEETKYDDSGNSIVVLDHFVSVVPTMTQEQVQEYQQEQQQHNHCQQEPSYNTVLKTLRARAPLEAPNPKKPGESKFIEEDMMDLLETV